MKGKTWLALLALIAMSHTGSVLAAMSLANGWYLDGNVGTTNLNNKNYPTKDKTHGWGLNVDLGYKFMPFMGMELGYTRFAETVLRDNFDNKVGTDKHDTYHAVLKGILPIGISGFELFAKLGPHRLLSKVQLKSGAAPIVGLVPKRASTINLYMALGAQYYFLPELSVVGQWARARGNAKTGTLDLYSVGLNFIFS